MEGGLHGADQTISKFKTNEAYVKAEALARRAPWTPPPPSSRTCP